MGLQVTAKIMSQECIILMLQKLSQNMKKKKAPELNFNTSLTLIPKPDTVGTKKENRRLISLSNTDAKP